jgi:hypothetical protein
LPRVEAPDQLRSTTDEDGLVDRARSNPRLLVAIVGGAILVLAWIAWAIYVTSSDGATAGLGVVITWPAVLAALALISLPFIGVYLLIRRPSEGGADTATAEAGDSAGQEEEDSEDEPDEADEHSDEEEPEKDEDDEEESESEDDSEAEASAAG